MMFPSPSRSEPAAGSPPRAPEPWHLLSGEYPPQFGGVADYSALIASGLAERGLPVHVWAPSHPGPDPGAPGVTVHRDVAGRWSRSDLARLSAALDATPGPRRLLVQYTPNAWGYKGMNLGFGRWLRRRREAGDAVWAMVHEAAYPWRLRDKPPRWLLPPLHRLMLRDLAVACERIYVSTPSLARHFAAGARWLPVPSNIPVVDDPAAVAAIRARLGAGGEAVVGHFGTYGEIARRSIPALARGLLAGRQGRSLLLIGRGGEPVLRELVAADPGLAGRVMATGALGPEALSAHIQACDVMAQCYDDGVSTRRGTIMACLAHARPTATNLGPSSGPIWIQSGGVAAVARHDPAAVARTADSLLADPAERAALAARALALYEGRFAVARSIDALVHDAARETIRS